MESSNLHHGFIQDWLKSKRQAKNFNKDVLDAIEKSLGGLKEEELDEANLLKLLKEIDYRDKKNG